MSERRVGPHVSPATQPWCWPHSSPDLFSFPSSIPSSPNDVTIPLLAPLHSRIYPSTVHYQRLSSSDKDSLSESSIPPSPTSVKDTASPCQVLDLEFYTPDVLPPAEQLSGSSDALLRDNLIRSKLRLRRSMNVEHCSLAEGGNESLKSHEAHGNVFPVLEDRVDDIWRKDRKRCAVLLHDYLKQGSSVEFSTIVEERSNDIMERDSNHRNGIHCTKHDEALTLDIDVCFTQHTTNSTGGMFATRSRPVVTLTQDLSEADSKVLTCAVVGQSPNKLETLRHTVDTEQSSLLKKVKSHSMVTRTRKADTRASRVQHHERQRARKMRGRGAGVKTPSHSSKETAHKLTRFKECREHDVAGEKVIHRAGNNANYVVRLGRTNRNGLYKKTNAPRKMNQNNKEFFFGETAKNHKEIRQRVGNKEGRSARDARYRYKIRTKLADLKSIFDFDPALDPLTCLDSCLVQSIDWVHPSGGSGSKEKGLFGNSRADSNDRIARNSEIIVINEKISDGNNDSNAGVGMNGNNIVEGNDRNGITDSNVVIGINGSNSVGNDSSIDSNARNISINSNDISGFTSSSSSSCCQEESVNLSGTPVSPRDEIIPKRKYNKSTALKKKDLIMFKAACGTGNNELPAAMIRSDTGDWISASSRKCFAFEPVPSGKFAMKGQPWAVRSPKLNEDAIRTVINPYSMVNPNLVLDIAQLYGSTEVRSDGIIKLEEDSVVTSKRPRGRGRRGHSLKRGISRQVPSPMSLDASSPFWSAGPLDTLWGCSSAPCQTSEKFSGMDSLDESDCFSSNYDRGVFEGGGLSIRENPFGGNSGDWLSDQGSGDDLKSSEAVAVPLQGELRERILINAHKYILEEEEKWTTLMRNASDPGEGRPCSAPAPSVQAIRAAFSGLLDQYGQSGWGVNDGSNCCSRFCWRTQFETGKEDREAVVKAGARRYANRVKETITDRVKTTLREEGRRYSRPRTLDSQIRNVLNHTHKCNTQDFQTKTLSPLVRFVVSTQGAGEKEDLGVVVSTNNSNRGIFCKDGIHPPSVREDNVCEITHHRKIAVKQSGSLFRKPLRVIVLPKCESFPPPKQTQQLHVDTMQTFQAKENIAREPDSDCSVLDANTLPTSNGCPMVKFIGKDNIDDEHDEVDPVVVTKVSTCDDGSVKATERKVDLPLSRASNPSTGLPEFAYWMDTLLTNNDGVLVSSSNSSVSRAVVRLASSGTEATQCTDRGGVDDSSMGQLGRRLLDKVNTLSTSASCASTNTTLHPPAAEPIPSCGPSQPVKGRDPKPVTVFRRFIAQTSAPDGRQAAGAVVQLRPRKSVVLLKNPMRKTKSSFANRTFRLFSSNSTDDDKTSVRSASFTDSVAPSKRLDTTTVLTVVNPCLGTEPIEVECHLPQSSPIKPLVVRNLNSSPATLQDLKQSAPVVNDGPPPAFRASLSIWTKSEAKKESLPNASEKNSVGMNVSGQSNGSLYYPLVYARNDIESLTDPRSSLGSLVNTRGCLESLTDHRGDPRCGLESFADPRGGIESCLESHADHRGGPELLTEHQGLPESFANDKIDLKHCTDPQGDRESGFFNTSAIVEVSVPRSIMENLVEPQHPFSCGSSLSVEQVDLTADLDDQHQFIDSFIGDALNNTHTQPATSQTDPSTQITNTSASHDAVGCVDRLPNLIESKHDSGLMYHVMPVITQFDGHAELLNNNCHCSKVQDSISHGVRQSPADIPEYFEQVMNQSQNRSHAIVYRNIDPSVCAKGISDDTDFSSLEQDSRAKNYSVESCERYIEHAYRHTPTPFSVPFNGSSERSLILPSKLSSCDDSKPPEVIAVAESLSLTQLCSSTGATMSGHAGKATIADVSYDVDASFEDPILPVVSSVSWSGSVRASVSTNATSGVPSSAIYKTKPVHCPVAISTASQRFMQGTDTLDVSSQEVQHNDLATQIASSSSRSFCCAPEVVPSIRAVRPTQTSSNAVRPSQPLSNAVRPTQPPSIAVRPTQPPSNAVRPTQPLSNAVRPTQPPSNAVRLTQPHSNAVRPTLLPFSAIATPRKRGPKIPPPRSPKCARSLMMQFSNIGQESSGDNNTASSSLHCAYDDLPLRQLDDYF